MSAAPDRRQLAEGVAVSVDDEVWTVVQLDLVGGSVVVATGQRTRKLSVEAAMNGLARATQITCGVVPVVDDDIATADLSQRAADRYRFQVRVVRFVNGGAEIGDVEDLLFAGEDGTFDLGRWAEESVGARIRHVQGCLERRQSLGTLRPGQFVAGESTIKQWRAAVRDRGESALLRRRRHTEPDDLLDPRFIEAVDELAAGLSTGSTLTQKAVLQRAVDACEAQGLTVSEIGSARARARYVGDAFKKATGSAKTAKQRRTDSLRPAPGYGGNRARWAMQQVEMDQHTIDLVTSSGRHVTRYTMVGAADSVSGEALALRMGKPSIDRATTALVFYDLLSNRPLLDADARARVYAGIPELIYVGEHVSFGPVFAVTVDRGSEFVNRHVYEVCSRAGITVVICAPRQPTQKPVIEAMFGAVHAAAQLLPGFVGSSPDHRGTRITLSDTAVPPSVVEAAMRAGLSLYNDTPNRAVPGGGKSTPRERFLLSLAQRGHLHALVQPQNLYMFLPRHDLTLTNGGLRKDNRIYDCQELHSEAWWGNRHGSRVPARVDDRDRSRIFVPHPDPQDGRWLSVPDNNAPTEHGYSAEWLADLAKTVGARGTNALKEAVDLTIMGAVRHPFNELQQTIERDRVAQSARDRAAAEVKPVQGTLRDYDRAPVVEIPRTAAGELPLADAF